MTFEAYEELLGARHALDRLGEPTGIEDVEFVPPMSREIAVPASID